MDPRQEQRPRVPKAIRRLFRTAVRGPTRDPAAEFVVRQAEPAPRGHGKTLAFVASSFANRQHAARMRLDPAYRRRWTQGEREVTEAADALRRAEVVPHYTAIDGTVVRQGVAWTGR